MSCFTTAHESRANHANPGRSPTWDAPAVTFAPAVECHPLGSHASPARTGQSPIRTVSTAKAASRTAKRLPAMARNAISAPTAHSQTPTGRHASLAQLDGSLQRGSSATYALMVRSRMGGMTRCLRTSQQTRTAPTAARVTQDGTGSAPSVHSVTCRTRRHRGVWTARLVILDTRGGAGGA